MVWCMKTVLKIAELLGCPAPAQGRWEEEHKNNEQRSPVDLCTKKHHHLIHMGATLPSRAPLLSTTKISQEFFLLHVLMSLLIQPSIQPESFHGSQILSFQASLKIAKGPQSTPLRQSEKFGKEVLQKYLLCEHPSAGLHRN